MVTEYGRAAPGGAVWAAPAPRIASQTRRTRRPKTGAKFETAQSGPCAHVRLSPASQSVGMSYLTPWGRCMVTQYVSFNDLKFTLPPLIVGVGLCVHYHMEIRAVY